MKQILKTTLLLGLALTLRACDNPEEHVILLAEVPATGHDQNAVQQTEELNDQVISGRSGLRIVGSSTVFPFITAVAENFGAKTQYPTPVVEASGTGGGMNYFCAGVGEAYPDLTSASRQIRPSEYQLCVANGVTQITEIPIGYDGIVLGNSVMESKLDISKKNLFLALAAQIPMPVDDQGRSIFTDRGLLIEGYNFADISNYKCDKFIDNPFQRWSDLSPALPSYRIEVFGPPPTSGTRDAFVELGLHIGAKRIDCLGALEEVDPNQFSQRSSRIREDGAWIDAGENDNTIVQTLANTPQAFGLFGYSFLEQNGDRIQAAFIDGVDPSYNNIATGVYPISRSLFVYAKVQHLALAPGLAAFIDELTSEDAWGPFGYLVDKGLIGLTDSDRSQAAAAAQRLDIMGPI